MGALILSNPRGVCALAGTHEAAIDPGLVRRLLSGQFPQWADLPVEPVAAFGTDNATYRLGSELIARLPRFLRWAGQVEREQRWLPHLAPHLPLTISTPLAMGDPAEGYPYQWSVYKWIQGENPSMSTMADPGQTAHALAEFLTALQAIDATDGPAPQRSNAFRGVPMGDPANSVANDQRVRSKIAALDGLADTDALLAVWESAVRAPAWDRPPVWIHGDLSPGNLLAQDGRLSAVIDFGCLGVGDPACDLMVAWVFLSPPARAAFRDALAVDDATWARGRGWGLASSLPEPQQFDDPVEAERLRARLAEFIAD